MRQLNRMQRYNGALFLLNFAKEIIALYPRGHKCLCLKTCKSSAHPSKTAVRSRNETALHIIDNLYI